MATEPPARVITTDPDSDLESVASLPESVSSGDSDGESIDDDEEESDAEREWKESLKQLELMLTLTLIPYLGKYFGRKSAYWLFARLMRLKYPVEVVVTNPTIFKGVGAIGAAVGLQ